MTNFKEEYSNSWIGVDFDGTLATYDGWKGPTVLGNPIKAMVDRVKNWIQSGVEVRIMTARVWPGKPNDAFNDAAISRAAIEEWCDKHIGTRLKVVHEKDYAMVELWDDRAIQVEFNKGTPLSDKLKDREEQLIEMCNLIQTIQLGYVAGLCVLSTPDVLNELSCTARLILDDLV